MTTTPTIYILYIYKIKESHLVINSLQQIIKKLQKLSNYTRVYLSKPWAVFTLQQMHYYQFVTQVAYSIIIIIFQNNSVTFLRNILYYSIFIFKF